VQLRISTRTIDGVLIVDCNGRIVFGEESANLRDTVKKLINENKNIVLNLSGVSYIDSGGLGTLVALYTSAQTNGGKIKLASLTPRVGDLLQVTKLVTIFEVYDNEEQAVQGALLGHRHLVDCTARIATRAVPLQHGFERTPLGMRAAEMGEGRRTAAHDCAPMNRIVVALMVRL